MKPPFDIAGDLDTPVSAFAKLGPFQPRFLLESVEGGERLGRYSFIGFGDALQVRLDAQGFHLGAERREIPRSQAELLDGLRAALAQVPLPLPALGQVPLAGGLVGFTAYDIVRFFERLPRRTPALPGVPLLHYVAPRSLLVFDHVSRAMALLHAGSDAERNSLRRELVGALRGPVPQIIQGRGFTPPRPRCRVMLTCTVYSARRNTSPPATSISWCCRRASRVAMGSIPSRCIGPCG